MADANKVRAIQAIVQTSISSFVNGFELKYDAQVDDPEGVINLKMKNEFINKLGPEFMFYSALVRSFDSAFGKVLENIGNAIAEISFDVRRGIDSYLLPLQSQHIDNLINQYNNTRRNVPLVEDYSTFTCMHPVNTTTHVQQHETDNYFYDPDTSTHYLIELKAGGDLDSKKARIEKDALLREYFLLKNALRGTNDQVVIKFATAYNKDGEGNYWKQGAVRKYFSDEELLIGRDYWNFVCNDPEGFEIVMDQYERSAQLIRDALQRIKDLYFEEN